jgi:VWFA-related protein
MMRMQRSWWVSTGLIAGLAVLSSVAGAQQIGTNKAEGKADTYTLSVKSQLVVETVVAKDKAGKFINGLTAKDFTLTEDGVVQTIKFCEHEQMPTDVATLPVVPSDQEQLTVYKRLTRTSIAAEGPAKENGPTKYQGHRLLAMYFDMSSMGPEDQLRALSAAQKFIRTQMTAADLVSIMRFNGGAVDVL